PSLSDDSVISYYLPKGKWTHLLTGEVVEGGSWRKEKYDYMSLPLFVRENSLLPMGANDEIPDYDYAEDVTFHVYELADGKQASATVNDLNGKTAGTVTVTRSGETLEVEADMADKPFHIHLVGHAKVESTTSGSWTADEKGVKVSPEKSVTAFSITL